MSWHYSQALVEACSEVDSSDGELLRLLKSVSSSGPPSCDDKRKAISTSSQSGMMLEHSTGNRFVDEWILSLEAFPASLTVSLELCGKNRIKEIYGLRPSELYKTLHLDTCSWKMSLNYLLGTTSEKSSRVWPSAGILFSMQLYQRPQLERITNELEFGSQELLPTPLARDWKDTGRSGIRDRRQRMDTLPRVLGGSVNPDYSEWMMGWPIGWTALSPLETDKFQEWLELHGSY